MTKVLKVIFSIPAIVVFIITVMGFLAANDFTTTKKNMMSWLPADLLPQFIKENTLLCGSLLVLLFVLILLIIHNQKKTNVRVALAGELETLSKSISEMLSEYPVRLDGAKWKPHLVKSDRVEKMEKTSVIEAEIQQKYKMKFEHKALTLLKRADGILNKDCLGRKNKYLEGYFMLNRFCVHLIDIAGELKKK
jgi:hypothetical protein